MTKSKSVHVALIAGVLAASGFVSLVASTRNSLTFDETFMISAGVRGVATGDMSMAFDQPPLMFYVYGAVASVASRWRPSEDGTVIIPLEARPNLPKRIDATKPVPRWGLYSRYEYARTFFADPHNDPEAIALAARSLAVVAALCLGLAVVLFAWFRFGQLAALLSVTALMFAPDVLAHSGVAWNDLPLALAFFLGLWAWDAALRNPTPTRMVSAGAATAVALGIKFSALALGPAAIALALLEFGRRGIDRPWLRRVALLVPAALVVTWALLAILFRGDLGLIEFREGVANQLRHSAQGHGVPAFLLGRSSEFGLWYFYPVAMLLKAPVALMALLPIVIAGHVGIWRKAEWSRDALGTPLRPLFVGILTYGFLLMRSPLAIGVRYALPLLPLFALLIGIGLSAFWERFGSKVRVTIAALLVAHAASAVAYYPWYLTYLTEFVPHRRTLGYRTMVDSNLDWGQGLLAVRDFMSEEGIPSVYLSYFGLALPESYGIHYSPLPSWMPLPEIPQSGSPPQWVVISATHLQGSYESDDPFREFRSRQPDRVLANSVYAFRLR